MGETVFSIGAEGIDTTKLVEEIQAEVRRKEDEGVYADARISRAERMNLSNLRNQDEFQGFYMRCLRDAVFVDISDFEIREKRQTRLAPFLVKLKKSIWGLLRFYTYRLWSQQNEVNGMMVTAVEGLDEKYAARIEQLEKRIAELEKVNKT